MVRQDWMGYTYMACELLVRGADARSRVETDKHVNTVLLAPTYDTVKMPDTTSGPVFASLDDVLVHPVSYWNTYGIETKTCNLFNIVLCDPGLPVLFESGVGFVLTDTLNALPFIIVSAAAHGLP
ncbi:hypothetical protein HG530_011564 [Fusarium avenaceum]|nr:hypothetical protein HG530_011564 [Fusarium avenaceum]